MFNPQNTDIMDTTSFKDCGNDQEEECQSQKQCDIQFCIDNLAPTDYKKCYLDETSIARLFTNAYDFCSYWNSEYGND